MRNFLLQLLGSASAFLGNLYLQKTLRIRICNTLSSFGFREEAPFDASTLVLFRKRILAEVLIEANEYLLDYKDDLAPSSEGKTSDDGTTKEDINKGTLTLDATCAPANIRYPQDISLLN